MSVVFVFYCGRYLWGEGAAIARSGHRVLSLGFPLLLPDHRIQLRFIVEI